MPAEMSFETTTAPRISAATAAASPGDIGERGDGGHEGHEGRRTDAPRATTCAAERATATLAGASEGTAGDAPAARARSPPKEAPRPSPARGAGARKLLVRDLVATMRATLEDGSAPAGTATCPLAPTAAGIAACTPRTPTDAARAPLMRAADAAATLARICAVPRAEAPLPPRDVLGAAAAQAIDSGGCAAVLGCFVGAPHACRRAVRCCAYAAR